MGDAIQAVKAGILEIADVFVVNKADRDGADATVPRHPGHDRARRARAGRSGGPRWSGRSPRAARASTTSSPRSTSTGPGWPSTASCAAAARRRAAAEIEAIALGTLRARIGSLRDGTALPALAAKVAAGALDPYAAADELLAQLGT